MRTREGTERGKGTELGRGRTYFLEQLASPQARRRRGVGWVEHDVKAWVLVRARANQGEHERGMAVSVVRHHLRGLHGFFDGLVVLALQNVLAVLEDCTC